MYIPKAGMFFKYKIYVFYKYLLDTKKIGRGSKEDIKRALREHKEDIKSLTRGYY
jgi:hypothetical protein